MALGMIDGAGDGSGVGSQPSLSRFASKHSSGQHSGHSVNRNGRVLQFPRKGKTCMIDVHVGGRSSSFTSQHFVGHSSIKKLHPVGVPEGDPDGVSVVGFKVGDISCNEVTSCAFLVNQNSSSSVRML